MRFPPVLALVSLGLVLAPGAFALPTMSLGGPASVDVGSSFTVDILISDVGAATPLNGFEFDLLFDGSVLTATSVIDGGFLLAPVFQVQNIVGGVSVEFAEVTLSPNGASGSGVLATIAFQASSPGNSNLDLSNVILSAPFGVPIDTAAVLDGTVSVGRRPGSAVPEPSGMLLSTIGLSIFGIRLRRHRR